MSRGLAGQSVLGKKKLKRMWEAIAVSLYSTSWPRFVVTKRSVRDHMAILMKKYKKMRDEEKASGISPEPTCWWV